MSNNLYNKYRQACEQKTNELPNWRKGQVAFNVLVGFDSELADSIHGTELDPFYKDDNEELKDFWDHVGRAMLEKEVSNK